MELWWKNTDRVK